MRFKKIIVITLLLIFALSSVCCAAFDEGTWLCVHKENDIKFYTNTKYIQFLDNGNTALVWVASGPYNKPPSLFGQMIIKSNRTFADICFFISIPTDSYDLVIGPDPLDVELQFYDIRPNTREAAIYSSLFGK